MAGRIPPQFIDDLLARTDIVELINSRVPLRKAGKDYQACCPFHDEKTPSFTVSREKQFYHCFGCGAHGSAVGFLMEYDHQGFREAVEELAQQAGMEVPSTGEAAHSGPDLRPLYDLLEQAAAHYRHQLRRHPEARRAVDYLKGRGLTGEVAAAYGLGYAPPGWDLLLKLLGGTAPERERLLQCGLIIEQDGKRYDRFRDRIMFPIRDRRGRVIGFGGRILGDGKPKYLNSPETPVFHKGRELYGLYEAQQARRKIDRLLVVEGYMDVIALAQFGITYAVATLGTATTQEHLQLLLRAAPELVFCFDGDRAGRAAAWKALETVLPLATGRQQVGFLFLPEGEDPDTLVRQEGKAAFEQRLQVATPLSDFLFEQLAGQVDMTSLDGRARLAALAKPLLEQVPSGLFREMLSSRLAALVGVARTQIEAPRALTGPAQRRPTAPPRRQPLTPLRLAIALLLQRPQIADQANTVADDWRRLEKPGIDLLAELLDLIAAYPEITKGQLVERWRETENHAHVQRLSSEALLSHIPENGREAELKGALERLNKEVGATEAQRLFERTSPTQWTEGEKERLRQVAAKTRRQGR
ncbi:MAG: DNA primase [Pseudomonadota bacterium]|nr:DNA primase [Pseudomonadota bacterium]